MCLKPEARENRTRLDGVDVSVRAGMPDQPAIDANRDSLPFERFYEREYVATVRLAGFLSGDRSLAEDLAQEAFIRLQRDFSQLENPGARSRSRVFSLTSVRRMIRQTRDVSLHFSSTRDL